VSPIGDTYTEAPSIAGAFLVSGTPHIGKPRVRGTGDGGGVLIGVGRAESR